MNYGTHVTPLSEQELKAYDQDFQLKEEDLSKVHEALENLRTVCLALEVPHIIAVNVGSADMGDHVKNEILVAGLVVPKRTPKVFDIIQSILDIY